MPAPSAAGHEPALDLRHIWCGARSDTALQEEIVDDRELCSGTRIPDTVQYMGYPDQADPGPVARGRRTGITVCSGLECDDW